LYQTVNLAPSGYGGSNPSPPTDEEVHHFGELFCFIVLVRFEQERGRENESFPGEEELKPQGFKDSPLAETFESLSTHTKIILLSGGLFYFCQICGIINLKTHTK
jgi:hypothetical protein